MSDAGEGVTEAAVTIRVCANGPLLVRGEVVLLGEDGEPVPVGRSVALCRCGRSSAKPLCDGTHKVVRRTE